MVLAVLADDDLKQELISNGLAEDVTIIWLKQAEEFENYSDAEGFLDLLFTASRERINLLRKNVRGTVIINSVCATLKEIDAPFIRINGWPGFLKRTLVEASCGDEHTKRQGESIFQRLNRKAEWVADHPGFVTARIIATIINEAWFTLEEGISTKQEIDVAMKLGTNYPFGPFEWCEKIGAKNVHELLQKLSDTEARYQPAALLTKEASI